MAILARRRLSFSSGGLNSRTLKPAGSSKSNSRGAAKAPPEQAILISVARCSPDGYVWVRRGDPAMTVAAKADQTNAMERMTLSDQVVHDLATAHDVARAVAGSHE